MQDLNEQPVLVIGLRPSGAAAGRLLLGQGRRVTLVDGADTPEVRRVGEELRLAGATVLWGREELPGDGFGEVVAGGEGPAYERMWRAAVDRGFRVISDLEVGYRAARCLQIAVTGTNGKTSTLHVLERMLSDAGRQVLTVGTAERPVCEVLGGGRELDFLMVEASAAQLAGIEFFRPVVAVVTNVTSNPTDGVANHEGYARAKARVFRNQQAFDWVVIQSEALALFRALDVPVPSKAITFSANNRRADIFLDRGMLVSRLEGWTGPLLDLDTCRLAGRHQAENLMAALAVGRILRIPLDQMVSSLRDCGPLPHRCEPVGEAGGIRFVNDAKATNLGALQRALESMPAGAEGRPNLMLIAGGRDLEHDFYGLGPLISRRVKCAFLLGESRHRLRAAWSLFTPCTLVDSLLEAVPLAADAAVAGDVVLFSPACSSFDMFQDYRQRGDVFREAALRWIGQVESPAPTRAGIPEARPESPPARGIDP